MTDIFDEVDGYSDLDTKLSPAEESRFQSWKSKYAPNDSGFDYDLRGAFKAGFTPDPKTGHWLDTFKKPNHPTFSNQSQYYSIAPERAGKWDGDTFVPPGGDIFDVVASTKPKRNEGMGRPPGPPDEIFGARFAEGATRGLLSGGPLMDMGRELMDPEYLQAAAGGPGAMALHQLKKVPGMVESLMTPEGLGNAVAGLPYMLMGAEYAPEGVAATKGAASEVARYAPKVKAAAKGAGGALLKPRSGYSTAAGSLTGQAFGNPAIGAAIGTGIPMAIDAVKAWKATPKTPLKPPPLPEPPPMLAREPMSEPVVVPEPPPGPWSAQGSTNAPEATRPTPGPTGPLPNMTGALPAKAVEVPKPPGTIPEEYLAHPRSQHDFVKPEAFFKVDTERVNAFKQVDPKLTKQDLVAITDPAIQRDLLIKVDKARGIKNPKHTAANVPGTWERLLILMQ